MPPPHLIPRTLSADTLTSGLDQRLRRVASRDAPAAGLVSNPCEAKRPHQTPWGQHCSSSIVPAVFAVAERQGGVRGPN